MENSEYINNKLVIDLTKKNIVFWKKNEEKIYNLLLD